MKNLPIKCSYCGKIFLRSKKRIKEGLKRKWQIFCSQKCLAKSRNKQKTLKCGNPNCNKIFKRQPHDIPLSGICFCSSSCAAIVNNPKSPKRHPKIRICPICGTRFASRRKYCSTKCQPKPQKIPKKQIINEIKKFYKNNGRIPVKREYYHSKAARFRFETWNKAIKAAGFEPNPVLFAKKYTANDGHKCDSLSEKIIDDWLHARKIKHQTNVVYPENKSLTTDFVIGDNWIEFFGLNGELKSYDRIKEKKLKIAKKFNLRLIPIYPQDLFPKSKLDKILNNLNQK